MENEIASMNIPTEKQASSLRRYFFEYVVLALVIAVITLFGMYYNLNRFIADTLLNNNVKMETVIERNNDLLLTLKNK